jgi:hypothetical protein
MSKLEFMARPLVAFDPNNKDHRRWYAEFVEYGGWGKCPVRFIVTDDHGLDLTLMIKNMLTQYYIDREFGGGKLAQARSSDLKKTADEMYREAGKLRKEATALLKPRRS